MNARRRGVLVYISGKMTGLAKEEFTERFKAAEKILHERGYRTCNPARFVFCRWDWLYRWMGYRLCLVVDLWMLMRCDRIYLIPGWQDSCGARIESFTAWSLGVKRLPLPVREEIDQQMEKG